MLTSTRTALLVALTRSRAWLRPWEMAFVTISLTSKVRVSQMSPRVAGASATTGESSTRNCATSVTNGWPTGPRWYWTPPTGRRAGVTATIVSSVEGATYMVGFEADGMEMTNHKWVVESEMEPAP